MGIGSNLSVEIAEQEHREALFEEVINEAAASVAVNGQSRESAYQDAKDLISARQEALAKGEYSEDGDSNTISFFDSSLEGITVPSSKKSQVAAIVNELRERFEGSF